MENEAMLSVLRLAIIPPQDLGLDSKKEFFVGVIDEIRPRRDERAGHYAQVCIETPMFNTSLALTKEDLSAFLKRIGCSKQEEASGRPVIVCFDTRMGGNATGIIPIAE